MLHRARMCFRIPIPPKDPKESSVSLFVRHARASKAVNDRLVVLERAIRKVYLSVGDTISLPYKDEKVIDGSIVSKTKVPLNILIKRSNRFSGTSLYESGQLVEPLEVRHVLNIALCLLGCPDPTYFEDPNEAHEISQQAASSALDWKVTKLCGMIGALAYKFAKSRICRQNEQEDEQFLAFLWRLMMSREAEDDVDDEDDVYDDDEISVDASEMNADQILLDKARLVLHRVVLRDRGVRVSTLSPTLLSLHLTAIL